MIGSENFCTNKSELRTTVGVATLELLLDLPPLLNCKLSLISESVSNRRALDVEYAKRVKLGETGDSILLEISEDNLAQGDKTRLTEWSVAFDND